MIWQAIAEAARSACSVCQYFGVPISEAAEVYIDGDTAHVVARAKLPDYVQIEFKVKAKEKP